MSTPVKILIVSKQPKDLDSTVAFLLRRGYNVTVKDNLRDGIACIAKETPDWVFVSINLSTAIEKMQLLIFQTFKIEAVLFSDTADVTSLSRLSRTQRSIITAKLTGPAIQMYFLHATGYQGQLESRKKTVGVKRSSFDPVQEEAANELESKYSSHQQLSPRLTAVHNLHSPAGPFNADAPVDEVAVMVRNGKEISGYMVFTGPGSKAAMEAAKAKLHPEEWTVLGAIKTKIESLTKWASDRALLVKPMNSAEGEAVSIFLPENQPLPNLRPSAGDQAKLEVAFEDIPTETGLPCPMYVHLPENDKFICLIKADGHFSLKQKRRLEKLGVPNLLIEKVHAENFKIFYVGQKILAPPA